MEINSYINNNFQDMKDLTSQSSLNTVQVKDNNKQEKLSLEEEINRSATKVALSMGAQIILDMMEAQQKTTDNSAGQKIILDFLSGKHVSDNFDLKNIGYEGKPITELSQEEATELIQDDGFFSIDTTANRVADFVLNFSGDNLERLEAGRKGVVQGFKDAEKMWGGELPQISYDTQTKTLELIDAKIAELKNGKNDNKDKEEVSSQIVTSVDIVV